MAECDLGGRDHHDEAIARYRHDNLRGGQVTKEGPVRYICSSHFANAIKYWAEHISYEPIFGKWDQIDSAIAEVEKFLGHPVQLKEVAFSADLRTEPGEAPLPESVDHDQPHPQPAEGEEAPVPTGAGGSDLPQS